MARIVRERGVVLVVHRGARARAGGASARTPRAAVLALGAGLLAGLLAAGCGAARQDAGEPKATFTMQVVHASFPTAQSISAPADLVLAVRNTGEKAAPDVAVTIDSFSYSSNLAELAANKRPVWVVEQGPGAIPLRPAESQEVSPPGGGQTAYVNTWALGRLAPGQVQTFDWKVVPVKAGLHTVHFTVAAGLSGKARATLASNEGGSNSGGAVQGQFAVRIAPAPSTRHVDPNTGKVIPGIYPSIP